jgi:hypothetical protein
LGSQSSFEAGEALTLPPHPASVDTASPPHPASVDSDLLQLWRQLYGPDRNKLLPMSGSVTEGLVSGCYFTLCQVHLMANGWVF